MKRFLQIFGSIAVVLSLVPLIAADYWWIRIFDFLHIQLTLLTLMALAAYFIRFEIQRIEDYIFTGILLACFSFQFLKLYPYTPLSSKELQDSSPDAKVRLSILAANVLQDNKEKMKMIREIQRFDPDILLLVETDLLWQKAVKQHLGEHYPFSVEMPLDNTYGMLLYSKWKLLEPKVQFLVDDSIPSIDSKLQLPGGDLIQLYAIHPTPPMPQHNPRSTDRDAEMMKIALKSRESRLPVLVTGDFNDVAWSQTTALFQEVGQLLDPRVGRGFYNTYNADHFLLRWALDHLFLSAAFRVERISLGRHTGSDHFPFFATLSFEPEKAGAQEARPAGKEAIKKAKAQIEDEIQEEEFR